MSQYKKLYCDRVDWVGMAGEVYCNRCAVGWELYCSRLVGLRQSVPRYKNLYRD